MEIVKNELQFYSKFARPLIFQLPDAKDRVLAAGWVKKIRDGQVGSEKLRTDYIKLLLFALQRQKLVGIFSEDPEQYEVLEEFPDNIDLNTMAKNLIRKEQFERVDRIRRQIRGQTGDSPPYLTDCSSDFREYVAAQDIPGFGVHCYYAISKDPIDTWMKADRGVFPKMAKSAVDTCSPVPQGLAESSDTPCVCPPAPGEPDSSCKARVHKEEPKKKKKKRSKHLGTSPPANPLGEAAAPPEERDRPSWSSNLMEIRDIAGGAGETAPARSTGAIPKKKLDKRQKVPVNLDDSDIREEMESAMRDYERGLVRAERQKKVTQKKEPRESVKEDVDEPKEEDVPPTQDEAPLDDNFDEIDQSQYQGEVDKDSSLMQYFKGKNTRSDVKQRLAVKSKLVKGACPAKSGIPLTTPKPSVLPKRQKSSEKLYREPNKDKKGVQRKKPSALKDPEVYKLFEEASALAIREDEEQENQMIEDEAPPVVEIDEDVEYQQLMEKQKQQEQALYEEPPVPIQRGSPEANAIFSDAVGTLQGESPIGFSDDWFEQVQNQADTFLPWDAQTAKDFESYGLPEVETRPLNISPYKPYKPEPRPRQPVVRPPRSGPRTPRTSPGASSTQAQAGSPNVGEVPVQSPRSGPRTPRTSPGASSTQAQAGSPNIREALGYTTPERLKIKKTERELTPQVMMPQPIPQLPKSCSLPDEDNSFFFDMSMEQAPDYWSPPHLSNVLTVQDAPPRIDQVISNLPPQNIIEAEPLDEANAAFILDGAPSGYLFDEEMPCFEGVDQQELDDEYVSAGAHSGSGQDAPPMFDLPYQNIFEAEPDQTNMAFMGSPCLFDEEMPYLEESGDQEELVDEQISTAAQYVSPRPERLSVPQRGISEQEQRYINYLFSGDEDMRQLMTRVSGMVADVDQEIPDPYHVVPESPEMPDVEGPDLFQDTSPNLDYYSSPESSPIAQSSQVPTSRIIPPGAGGIPRPRGAIPRRPTSTPVPGGRAPGTSGIPRAGGPSASEIPRPGGAGQRPGLPRPRQPAPSQPGPSQPGPSQPGPSQPGPSRPGPSRPGPGLPRPSRPGPSQPGPSQPGPSQPGPSQPAPSQPGPSRPGSTQPGPCQPGPSRPGPSQPRPPVHRRPVHAKQPLYFPQTPMISGQWPHMSLGFHRDMRDYQMDDRIQDTQRQQMTSRQVLVGATAGRRHDTRRRFRPRETIAEHPDEPDLTPTRYGPRSPTPAPSPAAPSPRRSPERPSEPAVPPTLEEMWASYEMPIYTSPGEGILEATAPFVDLSEDPEIRRELIYDETRENVPLDMRHMRRIMENRSRMTNELIEEVEELLIRRSTAEATENRQRSPTTPTQGQAASPCSQPYRSTPRHREPPRQRRRGQTRVPEGMRPRRINFDERDPADLSGTERYIAQRFSQHGVTTTPPATTSPMQYGILDEPIPPDVRLPSPLRPPTVVQGWQTPPRLSMRPPPPPPFQVNLPPVDPNQWFLQTQNEPVFTDSPPAGPEFALGGDDEYGIMTPELVQGGGRMGGLFFDDIDEISPLPDVSPSPERCVAACSSPVHTPRQTPAYQTPPRQMPTPPSPRRIPAPPTPRRMRTPPMIRVSPATPSDIDVTPLQSFDDNIFSPSPDAHMRTPPRANRIFEEAGVTNSPLRYSPLGDPAAMEEMIQRASASQGRRGIRIMREEASLPPRQRPPPPHTRPTSAIRQHLENRWVEEEEVTRDPTPMPRRVRRRPRMPAISEDRTPPQAPQPVGTPCTPRASRSRMAQGLSPPGPPPGPPADPFGLPLLVSDSLPVTPPGQRPPTVPVQRRARTLPRFSPCTRLDSDTSPGQERYIQNVMSRQNLPPLSPQSPVPPMDQPPTSREPYPSPTYDLAMPQVEGGGFFNEPMPEMQGSPDFASPSTPSAFDMAMLQAEGGYFLNEPMPEMEASPDLGSPPPPRIQITSPSPRTPDIGPSHGITMATCGSPRDYMPDSPLTPEFIRSPEDGFRTPERRMTAQEIFAGIQDSPRSPTMQEMVGRVRQAEGRRGIRRIRQEREGGEPERPNQLANYLQSQWSRRNEEPEIIPERRATRRRPGPPSLPTLKEQSPPFDRYGLPAIARLDQPIRMDPYYSPPPPTRTPRPRRDVLPDEPNMQRAIDNLRVGQAMDLEAIQVATTPPRQTPQSPCSPRALLGYKTPENLQVRQPSPTAPRALQTPLPWSPPQQRQRQQRQVAPPPDFNYFEQDESRRRGMSPCGQEMLMQESPVDMSQSPPQIGTPESFRSPREAMFFDQPADMIQFDSPPMLTSPQNQQRFGLPEAIQLPPPREINFAPVRPPVPRSARVPTRQPTPPCSPINMQDHQPLIPANQISFVSPPHLWDHWQQVVGENDPGMFNDGSPDFLQTSPRSPSGSPSPDRAVSRSSSKTRCITARRLDL